MEFTTKDLLNYLLPFMSFATLAASGKVLLYAYKIVRQNEVLQQTVAEEKLERQHLSIIVCGNSKGETNFSRHGLVGRMSEVEEGSSANSAQAAKASAQCRAILRGMNVPSDLSDDREVQVLVKKRISESLVVDRKTARLSLIADQERRWSPVPDTTRHFEELPPPATSTSERLHSGGMRAIPREEPPSDAPPPNSKRRP